MSATIEHSCGHREHHASIHGYFQPETIRFLSNSQCTACGEKAAKCQCPNRRTLSNGTQYYCPDCKRIKSA